jgi:prepilin-type N-terminal cleavage/methylation domain-containing protein
MKPIFLYANNCFRNKMLKCSNTQDDQGASSGCSNKSNQYNSGFTLVELSISLLIIGLIIGGITAGSSLVQQAKLRSVLSEVRNYQTAINAFKLQYGTIPGDLTNATSYWNTSNNGALATSLANGNGNGYIDNNEPLTAFQMLSLAGLTSNQLGYGSWPNTKYGQSTLYHIYNYGVWGTTLYGKSNGGGDFLQITYASSNTSCVTPADAYNIDVKMDDGVLYSGIVYTAKVDGYASMANKCTTLATSYLSTASSSPAITSDSYYLNDTSNSCFLFFLIID